MFRSAVGLDKMVKIVTASKVLESTDLILDLTKVKEVLPKPSVVKLRADFEEVLTAFDRVERKPTAHAISCLKLALCCFEEELHREGYVES